MTKPTKDTALEAIAERRAALVKVRDDAQNSIDLLDEVEVDIRIARNSAEPPREPAKPRAKPGEIETAALRWLGTRHATADEIATALAPEYNPGTVRRILRKLAKAGKLVEAGGRLGVAEERAAAE